MLYDLKFGLNNHRYSSAGACSQSVNNLQTEELDVKQPSDAQK